MNNQNPQDPFLHSKSLWLATVAMVKQIADFRIKPEIIDQVRAAGDMYVHADDKYEKIVEAGQKLYDANCGLRCLFGSYLRLQYGVLNNEKNEFFVAECPSQAIQAKCDAALAALDNALFGPESEKGIKTFVLRLNKYHEAIKTLKDAREEHQRDLESLRKLHEKVKSGATIGSRERAKLGRVNQLPEVKAEAKRAEAEALRKKQHEQMKSRRQEAVADLIPM